jgi:hypothetical protein
MRKKVSINSVLRFFVTFLLTLICFGCPPPKNELPPVSVSENEYNNLLVNGDFEKGNSGFTSEYNYSPGNIWAAGSYDIAKNPNNSHSSLASFTDHTSGNGNMMAINGSTGGGYGVWQEIIDVKSNTRYTFSGWIANCYSNAPSTLAVKINDIQVSGNIQVASQLGVWNKFYFTWESESSTKAKIQILDTNNASSGNDFAMDDICFKKSTVDLNIGWIHRSLSKDFVWDSKSPKVDGWPADGEKVKWEANITNWGSLKSSNVEYKWMLDGTLYKSGIIDSIDQNSNAKVTLDWDWTFTRHTLEFIIDPDNKISEETEKNNSLIIYTNAISLGFWVEKSLYDYFHLYQYKLGVNSNSWEDWAQRQVYCLNQLLSSAVYAETPSGVSDRIRIDAIHIVPDGSLPLNGGVPTNNPDRNDKTVDLQWGFPATLLNPDAGGNKFYGDQTRAVDGNAFYIEGSLPHELGHARYLIDITAFNVHDNGSGNTVAIKEKGVLITGTQYMPLVSSDAVHYTSMTGLMGTDFSKVDSYSAAALNLIEGNRAVKGNMNIPENVGTYLNDFPEQNTLLLTDDTGSVLNGAGVKIYQAVGNGNMYGKYFDETADIDMVADGNGKIILGKCPFTSGKIEYSSNFCNVVIIIRVEHNGKVGYSFLESMDFNMEYWRGNKTMGNYTVSTKLF